MLIKNNQTIFSLKLNWLIWLFIPCLLLGLVFFFPNVLLAEEDIEPQYELDPLKNKLRAGSDSASGAFVYNYPLAIPPGRNGLQPDLTLQYNSHSSDNASVYGYGWTINIPYIERINRKGIANLYTEEYFYSSISGELSEKSTADHYGPQEENGEFLLYEYDSTNNRWLATDKKGITYEFGWSASSRQDNPSDSDEVYKWMIEEIRDMNDNYIKYEYYKENGQIYPSKIKYTGNDTTDGIFEIEFIRHVRADDFSVYHPGFEVITDYRIREIQVKIDGTMVKKYNLSYWFGVNDDRSLIDTITETGWDEQENSIIFPEENYYYQDTTAGWSDGIFSDEASGNIASLWVGEFNGDGLSDIYVKTTTDDYQAYISDGQVWDNYAYAPNENIKVMADVNGDGLSDVLYQEDSSLKVDINDGTGWNSGQFASVGAEIKSIWPCELNGDGLTDIIIKNYSNEYSAYTNDGDSWNVYAYTPNDVKAMADVNGDGLSDVIYTGVNNTLKTDLNNGAGWTSGKFADSGFDPFALVSIWVGELNGDGLSDIIIKTSDVYAGEIRPFISDGHEWDSYGYEPDATITMADVDGDGLSDSIYYDDGIEVDINGSQRTDLLDEILHNKGAETKISYQSSQKYYDSSNDLLNLNLPLIIQTVSGTYTDDGFGNIIASSSYEYAGGYYYYDNEYDRKFAGFETITEVKNPDDTTQKTYYHQGNTSDTTHGEYSDDVSKIGKPYRVEIKDDSGNLYSKIINKWENYELNGQNERRRDFVKLTRTVEFDYDGDVDHKDKAVEYTYNNTYGNLTQKVEYGEVTGSDDGTFTDTGTDKITVDLDYAINTTDYIVGLPKIETIQDQSANKKKETKYYYDGQAYGSVLKGNETKQEMWKSGTDYIDIEKTYNSYGLVATEKDPRDKITTYTYDGYNLYPSKITNPLSQETDFLYDYSAGKVKKITDVNDREFETVFDALDRVKEEKQPNLTTPATLEKRVEYAYTDTKNARKVVETHHLDSATSFLVYKYLDGLDNIIQERKEAETTNQFAVKDFFYNELGLLATSTLPYFSTGSDKSSFTTTQNLHIDHYYDPLRRIKTITNAVGTTAYAYDQWETVITDAENNTKDLHKDAHNNLIKVEEHNGVSTYTTEYEYDALDNLTKITDADSNEREFTYDGLSRRLTAQDLHASGDSYFGTWTFTYDQSGYTNLLTTVLDPKSQTINYTYDDLNRALTENYTGQAGTEVQYGYDNCSDGKGRLCSATTNDIATTYTYNPLGLIKSEVRTIDSTGYTTQYDYDRQGSITEITYPDSAKAKYTYNTAGLLEKVERKEDGDAGYTNVIDDIDYSQLEQITYRKSYNGVETTNTYDSSKLYRLSDKDTTKSTTKLQDLAYTYDDVGNITQITDNSDTNTKKTANYTYDDLYRLTQAAITNVGYGSNYTRTYTYSSIGNITNKSDVGNYLYQGDTGTSKANPHAATSINSVTYAYDNNGNLTSDSTWTHTWDYKNRLTQSTDGSDTLQYEYDYEGNRIKKTEPDNTTFYINKYYEVDDNKLIKHYFTNGVSVATVEVISSSRNNPSCKPPTSGNWTISSDCTFTGFATAPVDVEVNTNSVLTLDAGALLEIDFANNKLLVRSGSGVLIKKGATLAQTNTQPTFSITYHHTDHLSGNTVETDSSGNAIEVIDYFPFGDVRADTGSHNNKYKYTGKELDSDTNLYYYGARYYNASIGRFISQDPWEGNLADPQSFNKYSYTRNNPIVLVDINGETYGESVTNYAAGVGEALWGLMNYGANWFWNPIESTKETIESIGQTVEEVQEFATDVAKNPSQTISEAVEGTKISAEETLNELSQMSDAEAGRTIGRWAGAAIIGGITKKAKIPGGTKAKNIHGNRLDSLKLNYGYTLRDKNTGKILKYGETANPESRYSKSYLDQQNIRLKVETQGSKAEIHQWQHNQILEYKDSHSGQHPPLNKSEW